MTEEKAPWYVTEDHAMPGEDDMGAGALLVGSIMGWFLLVYVAMSEITAGSHVHVSQATLCSLGAGAVTYVACFILIGIADDRKPEGMKGYYGVRPLPFAYLAALATLPFMWVVI